MSMTVTPGRARLTRGGSLVSLGALTLASFAAAAPAGAAPAATGSTASATVTTATPVSGPAACQAVADGRVVGLSGKPARVTLALASGYGTSYAKVTECVKSGNSYTVDFSVSARIGSRGFAAKGAKREGDGRSPSGVYSYGYGFGVGDPGSTTGYKKITSNSCWVDQSGSTYNTWQETTNCRGERMADYVSRDYAQGIVINYNTAARTNGAGSAIFLHASGNGSTAGCVSIPQSHVIKKMRATHSGDRIVMGVASAMIGPAKTTTPTKPPSTSSKITHTLKVGSPYRSEVRTLQEKLGVSADGLFGPGTKSAVQRYQRSKGLTADGIVGSQTRRALNGSSTSTPSRPRPKPPVTSSTAKVKHTLYPGSPYRSEVKLVQQKLGLTADGLYGPGTTSAVQRFQRSKGLSADGIAGADTLRAMNLR